MSDDEWRNENDTMHTYIYFTFELLAWKQLSVVAWRQSICWRSGLAQLFAHDSILSKIVRIDSCINFNNSHELVVKKKI